MLQDWKKNRRNFVPLSFHYSFPYLTPYELNSGRENGQSMQTTFLNLNIRLKPIFAQEEKLYPLSHRNIKPNFSSIVSTYIVNKYIVFQGNEPVPEILDQVSILACAVILWRCLPVLSWRTELWSEGNRKALRWRPPSVRVVRNLSKTCWRDQTYKTNNFILLMELKSVENNLASNSGTNISRSDDDEETKDCES